MKSMTQALPSFSKAVRRPTGAAEKTHRQAEYIDINGHRVRVDVFDPVDARPAHTVLLLHGVGGLLADAGLMRRAARTLAGHGFHACVVHYFNTTGTFFATHSSVHEHLAEWRSGIAEIAHKYAVVHGEPVGLLGYSLGGFLAVGAAEDTEDIGAIAVLAGGLCEECGASVPSHMPPLLVLHGGEDRRVPLDRADALVDRGRRAGAIVESVIYPREGHTFGASAEHDALDRVTEFFAVRLEAGAER